MNDTVGVLRLHSLGDVVMAQPAATALSLRNRRVILITRPEYTELARRMPGSIEPIAVQRGEGPWSFRRRISREGVDRVVDLQGNLFSRLGLSGRRVAGRFRTDRRLRASIVRGSGLSMPFRSIDFMNAAGVDGPRWPRLERCGLPEEGKLTIGVVCGGRWRMKSIPVGVNAEVCRILSRVHGADLVLLGAAADRSSALETASASGLPTSTCTTLEVRAGTGGIEDLICDIERLDALISPDSGPAHLAAALGVPLVLVFTSTSGSLGFWETGREGVTAVTGGRDLDCRPCHRHGGNSCRTGTEVCRKGLLPIELADTAMRMATS